MSTFSTHIHRELSRLGPGLRKAIESISWLMVDRVVRLGMGLFVGVWVARYLGPTRYGSLNFAVALVSLFTSANTLGMDGIIVREVVGNPASTYEILGTAFTLRSVGGFLAAGTSIAVLFLIQPGDRQALLLVSIYSLTLIFQAFDTIDCFFQSQVQSKLTVWAKNSAFLVFAAIRVTLIWLKEPLWMFVAAMSGEAALGAAGLLLSYRMTGGKISRWRKSRERAIELLRQSWPLIFSGLAIMIYMRLDTVMLKVMQGDFAVGLYSAATRVSEVWYFVPMAIVTSVSPAIMRVSDDPKLFYSRLRRLFSLMTVLAYSIGSIVALASRSIIHILYSNSYLGAAPVLAVHIWASVFVFLGCAQSPWDISMNQLKLSLYRTTAGAVINVVMNLYLIPRYSAMGAAIATVVSYAVSGVFANAFSARTRPIFYMQMKSFIPQRFWTVKAAES
jgi:PST family polysaccharide transporter